jgi:hypothetical protein
MARRAYSIASLLAIGLPCVSLAQGRDTLVISTRSIAGQVVDQTGRALSDALVVMDGGYLRATTDTRGRFRLLSDGGLHQLMVAKIGYTPDSIMVDVSLAVPAGADPSRSPDTALKVVLVRATQQLKAITVEGIPAPFMAQTVTAATVTNVPALAEPDIFRAVSLLPGVSTPNDTRGRLHLAGGASDEVGIRLDGHPLQDPFHLFGLLGAFNVAALERADILIHSVPPGMSDHLSGVIDLQTRRPTAITNGDVSVSVLATSASLGYVLPGGIDLLAAARITYFDKLLPLISHKAKVGGDEVPLYGFRDGILRFGHSSPNWRIEQIAFLTSDHLPRTGVANTPGYVPYNWGEYLIGARAERIGDRWTLSARASTGRNTVELDERIFRGDYLSNRYSRQSAAVEASTHASNWQFKAGVTADARRNQQDWNYRSRPEGPSPNAPLAYTADNRQNLFAYYGDVALSLGNLRSVASRWRLHAGTRVASSGSWRGASPSLGLEYKASSRSLFGIAAERRYQFQGIVEEPGSLTIRPIEILLQTPRVADVVGVSWALKRVELPLSGVGSFRLEAFAKRYQNQVHVLGPRYGELDQDYAKRFPELESVPGRATGALVSTSLQFGERFRLQGSYALERVRQTFDEESAPTSWDIPHQGSMFASVDLTSRWTIDAVYQAHSGVPITPVAARILTPIGNGFALPGFADGPRNSIRAPIYQRLDFSAQRHWRTKSGKEWVLSFHLLNALARANPVAIDWEQYYSALASQARGGSPPEARETMVPSLPLLPSVGLRVQW